MCNRNLTAADERAYAELADWAETDDAAKAFAAADDTPDDDATFQKVQEAARCELGRPRLDGQTPGAGAGRAPARQVRLPKQLDDQLAEYSTAHSTTRSAVIREALTAYLAS